MGMRWPTPNERVLRMIFHPDWLTRKLDKLTGYAYMRYDDEDAMAKHRVVREFWHGVGDCADRLNHWWRKRPVRS